MLQINLHENIVKAYVLEASALSRPGLPFSKSTYWRRKLCFVNRFVAELIFYEIRAVFFSWQVYVQEFLVAK